MRKEGAAKYQHDFITGFVRAKETHLLQELGELQTRYEVIHDLRMWLEEHPPTPPLRKVKTK
jgi:hypothetical protein